MLSILIVDDEPDFRNLLAAYITDNTENEVVCAENGIAATSILESHVQFHHPIDFIISDIYMPGMNGYKFNDTVRQMEPYKNIPFLFISGYDDDYARGAVREPHIEGFMKKSELPMKLLKWIEYLSTPLRDRSRLVRPAV